MINFLHCIRRLRRKSFASKNIENSSFSTFSKIAKNSRALILVQWLRAPQPNTILQPQNEISGRLRNSSQNHSRKKPIGAPKMKLVPTLRSIFFASTISNNVDKRKTYAYSILVYYWYESFVRDFVHEKKRNYIFNSLRYSRGGVYYENNAPSRYIYTLVRVPKMRMWRAFAKGDNKKRSDFARSTARVPHEDRIGAVFTAQ